MNWRAAIGIILVPLLMIGIWYVLTQTSIFGGSDVEGEPFAHEGNLLKDNPGLEPGVWYLSFDMPGSPELSVPLVFDHDTRCGSEGMLTVCNISFEQGQRVRVEGMRAGDIVRVSKLVYEPATHEDGTRIRLYFYDPDNDKNASGNILCSRQGLVAVERVIPKTQTPLTDAVKLLLRGEISDEERARGVRSEFPLPGVMLEKAVLDDGIVTLTFEDPQNKTGGGSCRVAVLSAQIEATAKQFPMVSQVRFEPEGLFQP